MRIFRAAPRNPYRNLWLSLAIGCLIASVVVTVHATWASPGADAVGIFLFAFWMSLLFGAGILILLAMPVFWVLLRFRLGGPGSAIAFAGALLATVSFPPTKELWLFVLFTGVILSCFLLLAYTSMFSNNRWRGP